MASIFKPAGIGIFLAAGLFGVFVAASRANAEPPTYPPFANLPYPPPITLPYIEWEFSSRIYGGDEDTRIARAHFVRGDYGLAALHYRRAVNVTPQNGAAWAGLAASYDRIGRYDLANPAHRQARRLSGTNHVLLNNLAYQRLLRGDERGALQLLYRAQRLAPHDPTIANNIAIAASGQNYFWNGER